MATVVPHTETSVIGQATPSSAGHGDRAPLLEKGVGPGAMGPARQRARARNFPER